MGENFDLILFQIQTVDTVEILGSNFKFLNF